jgi:hypothetical protein
MKLNRKYLNIYNYLAGKSFNISKLNNNVFKDTANFNKYFEKQGYNNFVIIDFNVDKISWFSERKFTDNGSLSWEGELSLGVLDEAFDKLKACMMVYARIQVLNDFEDNLIKSKVNEIISAI